MAHAPNNAPHHTQALTPLRAALDALPSTPDRIAATLRSLGLRGQRHSTAHCPLAAYARRILGSARYGDWPVEADRATVVVTCPDGTPSTLPLSPAAYDFVTLFDAGAYPDLEAEPDRPGAPRPPAAGGTDHSATAPAGAGRDATVSWIHVALQKVLAEVTQNEEFVKLIPDNPDAHLVAQKAIYLLQSSPGVTPIWHFGWYTTGPYSPRLAQDLRAASEHADAVIATARAAQLSPATHRAARALRDLLCEAPRHVLSRPCWLELLASVDYIARWRGEPPDSADVADRALRWKPEFTPDQIRAAATALTSLRSLPAEHGENEPWASDAPRPPAAGGEGTGPS
jgi:hypothetical protein